MTDLPEKKDKHFCCDCKHHSFSSELTDAIFHEMLRWLTPEIALMQRPPMEPREHLCLALPHKAAVNYVTGTAQALLYSCFDRNADGECTLFEWRQDKQI